MRIPPAQHTEGIREGIVIIHVVIAAEDIEKHTTEVLPSVVRFLDTFRGVSIVIHQVRRVK